VSGSLEPEQVSELAGRDWAELARSGGGGQETEAQVLRELLRVELGGSPYAIPVERVREIVRPKEITPVPRVPEAVLGVIELRGEMVQVLDLRRRLALELRDLTRKSRIIVLHCAEGQVSGVFVDGVDEVLRAPEDSISPASGASGFVPEVCARGTEFVSVLDVDRVLDLDV
jgi:purine-binding chemotaxis protein CheW